MLTGKIGSSTPGVWGIAMVKAHIFALVKANRIRFFIKLYGFLRPLKIVPEKTNRKSLTQKSLAKNRFAARE